MPSMDVLPTRIGHYEIRRVLGQGGMGVVYLAVDPTLQRQVALKVLRADAEEMRERFRREARLIARLQHPNIVAIYAVGEHEQQPFLAMEYIEGEPLSEGIRRRAPWGLQRKLLMVAELCAGLAFAHRAGIVHRDVKPSNLMISNGSGTLRLLDFGIARGDDAAVTMGLTLHGNIVGTMNYMSPEQITGQAVDHRSDIFSVGLVLYELLSYFQAFPGGNLATLTYRIVHGHAEPLRDLEPNLDPELYDVVEKATARLPDDRYQHLEALRTDLLRIAARLSPTEAAALASDSVVTSEPVLPAAIPVWSRALDPTVDTAGPVTPGPVPPAAPMPAPEPAPPGRPAWLVPVAATATLLGALTAAWLLVRQPTPPIETTGATQDASAPAETSRPEPATTVPPSIAPKSAAPGEAASAETSPPAARTPDARGDRPAPAPRESPTSPRQTLPPVTSTSIDVADRTPRTLPEPPPSVRDEPVPAGAAPEAPVSREPAAPAPAAPPPQAAPDDAGVVQALLTRWARAYAARDAHGIEAVMPGAEATYAKQFGELRSASSTLTDCRVTLQSPRATAECTEQFAFQTAVGNTTRQGTRRRRFSLEKQAGEWRITATSVAQ